LKPWVGHIAILILAASCQVSATDRLGDDRVGLKPPPGTPTVTEAVDGLIVGHRLMAAGEYELALSAYTRAAGEHGLNADVLSALGSANLRLGRLNQAKRMLESAVEKDPDFVAAWNNLGVVLMEQGETAQASRVFRNAYALDNGNSDEIRENLRLALAKLENPSYSDPNDNKFELVRRGNGRYLLLSTPGSNVEQ
jgi:tetratricopeptide (TPR) repeat protein